jgi:hypothetical protein
MEISTGERYVVPLDRELLDELDPDDPWGEVFSVCGMDLGPPKALVLPTLLGRERLTVEPASLQLIISVYKYSTTRYFILGLDEETATYVEKVLREDNLTDEHLQFIEACGDSDEELFNFFSRRIQVFEDSSSGKPSFRFELP